MCVVCVCVGGVCALLIKPSILLSSSILLSLITRTQSRDAIIDGTHPCTREEGIQFAALQCQIQYGNHNEAKHKPGFLNLVEFLPTEYTKLKGIEKNIFSDHRKLHNLSEINARFRYIQLCRSLRTYGVTFFLVKVRGRVVEPTAINLSTVDPISMILKKTFQMMCFNPKVWRGHNLSFFGLGPWAIIHGIDKLANTFISHI